MPTYKVVNSEQLDADLKVVADAIRSKSGTTASLEFPNEMKSAIESIEADEIPTQEKTVDITENGTTEIEADEGYLLSKATVNVNVASSGGGENKLAKLVDRSLTEVTAADLQGATKIGDQAFYRCAELTSITIPNSVTSIESSAIRACTELTSITFAENSKLTSIGNSAVSECKALTSVTLPNSVTNIAQYAFNACSELLNITIGSGITNLGAQVLFNVSKLQRVKILAQTPPTIQSNTFGVPNTCIFEVPAASVEAYKTATNWSNKASQIVASEEF